MAVPVSRSTSLRHFLFLLTGAFAVVASVHPATVSKTDDAGAGSLRAAIAIVETSADNDIHFDGALDGKTIVLTTGELTVMSTVRIYGSDLPHGITVSGNGATRIFLVNLGALDLYRVHLTRGNAGADSGGALASNNGSVYFSECSLTDNSAGSGGAVFGDGSGSLTLLSCTLSGNVADDSGALWVQDSLNATLLESTVTMNHCTSAGGTGAITRIGTGALTVVHSTVAGNIGGSAGGGIFTDSSLSVERSIIAANTATTGAAADIVKNTGTVTPTGPNLIGSNQSVTTEFPGPTTLVGTSVAPLDPRLGPLGLTGGNTRTLAPLSTSPALEAAGGSSETLDQRGFPRPIDVADLGSVERGPVLTVLNNADGGANSLRARLAATTTPDTRIQFDGSLNGATITLTSAGLTMQSGQSVEIDASTLSAGLIISGGNNFRVINTSGGKNLSLNRLTLTGGKTSSAEAGGALFVLGNSLLAVDCTFRDNNSTASIAGGIMVDSAIADLYRCTLSGNLADDGGALWEQGTAQLSLTNCTVAGNQSTGNGTGGISNLGSNLNLVHTTIVGNTGSGFGGGLSVEAPAVVRIERCLVAGNLDSGPAKDILKDSGTLIPVGNNLIGTNESVSAEFPTNSLHGTPAAPLDPRLGPLFRTGGFTATQSPSLFSPALDAEDFSPLATDQRGFPRGPQGVNGAADLGAVERGPVLFVINNSNAGGGSLREALDAATAPDTHILFTSPGMSGQTITLTSAELSIPAGRNLEIDASGLAAGLTISGNNARRVLELDQATVSLQGLSIRNGQDGASGGGILSNGNLLAVDCTFANNNSSPSVGGAINFSSGTGALHRCALSGNVAGSGGAIWNQGESLSLTNCTVAGNHTTGSGTGGLASVGTLDLVHTTITENTGSGGQGGGLYLASPAVVRVERCVIAGNLDSGTTAKDIRKASGTIIPAGNNLIGINDSVSAEFPANSLHGTSAAPLDAKLGLLGRYGGRTETIPLRPASPARDQGTGSSLVVDQRYFPRPIGAGADLGAYEAGTIATFEAWSEETFGVALTKSGDDDHDGRSNFLEYATLTNPLVASGGAIVNFSRNVAGTQASLIFPVRFDATDLFYELERSTTLTSWALIANFDPRTDSSAFGSGLTMTFGTNQLTFTDDFINGQSKVFYRLKITEQ
jgi:hypothetical protein